MIILVVNIVFVLLYLSILVNLTSAGELSGSACMYLGGIDPDGDVLEVDCLPVECTAYVYESLTYNEESEIVPTYYDDLENLRLLVENKPNNVFVFYQQANLDVWLDALYLKDPAAEAQKVQDFVDKYPVGGLILYGLEYPFVYGSDDFYQKLSTYVNAFKTKIKDFKIGLNLIAANMIVYDQDPEWFDFCKMNCVFDFYVIDFSDFNSCTPELLHGGITPIVSTNPDVTSLTKFAEVLSVSTIAKDKVHFQFLVTPKPLINEEVSFLGCEISYSKYCESDYYDTKLCVDNENSLYEKGEFVKQYAKGFIAKGINLIDGGLKCNCQNDAYITFHMLLNGYKGAEKITCDRLKC